jgi:hypothetical protein
MNMQQINELRASMNLAPLVARDTRAQKRQQDANRAARAQANRDMKAKRASRSK